MSTRPKAPPKSADQWIASQTESPGTAGADIAATKRLTIDLEADLHVRFKSACAQHQLKMVEEVRGFIETRVRELEAGKP